jgi:DNA-binding CsgD family transcriptional regulator
MAAAEILGRAAEMETLGRFLDAPTPTVLILEGPAGIGKTTVWHEGVRLARQLGHRVLVTRPLETDAKRSLTGLTDLLGDVFDELGETLPTPQHDALAIALLRAASDTAQATTSAITAGTLGLLRTAARDHPLLLAIDDLQWLDPSSRETLRFALRRFNGATIRFLATARIDAPADSQQLLTEDERRLPLGPLSLDALGKIIADRLGHPLPRPTLRRVHRLADGNAFLALELARRAPLDRSEPGPDVGTAALRRLLGDRFAGLPSESVEALATVAALAEPEISLVHEAIAHESLLDPGFEAGIIEETTTQVRFTHPLLAAAAITTLPPRRRRAMHARLAELIDDREQSARHLAAATIGPSAPVARRLNDAASQAIGRGAPLAAAELCEIASRLTPPDDVDGRGARLVRAGEHYEEAGDARRALALFRQAADELPPGPGRARALMFVASHEHTSIDAGLALMETAVSECGEDRESRIECLLNMTLGLECLGRARDARLRARDALALVDEQTDPDLRLWVLTTIGHLDAQLHAGEGRATLRNAMQLEGRRLVPTTGQSAATCLARVLVWADEFDEARALLSDVRDRARAAGDENGIAELELHLALLECRAGRFDAARAHADECLALLDQGHEHDQRLGAALYPRALVAAHEGDEEVSRRLATRGLAIARTVGDRVSAMNHLCALGFLELSLGNAAAALARLESLPAEAECIGLREPGLFMFHGDLLDALVATGAEADAATWAHRWDELGRRIDRPRLVCASARAHALVAAERGNQEKALKLLGEALTWHERLGDPTELGRTLLALGGLQRRMKRRRDARATLATAQALFKQIGAAGWAQRAAAEMTRISGRTPTHRDDLTPTERRVADLVASGKTNREVAKELFLTVNTVESNLTRVYRKLGVRSRTELARRFASTAPK